MRIHIGTHPYLMLVECVCVVVVVVVVARGTLTVYTLRMWIRWGRGRSGTNKFCYQTLVTVSLIMSRLVASHPLLIMLWK